MNNEINNEINLSPLNNQTSYSPNAKIYQNWEDITGDQQTYQHQLKAQEQKNQNFNQVHPIKVLFSLIDSKTKHALFLSALLAFIGELFGLIPFLLVAFVINQITSATINMTNVYLLSFGIIGSFFLKIVFTHFSTVISHHASFRALANIRKQIAQKMLKVPLGQIINQTSGNLKNLIVENVQRLEDSMAHYIPEMSSNISAPLLFIIAIFVIDWRMGLASLITLPISFIGFAGMMQDYQKRSEEYLTNQNKMNSTVIEYINGIQVIKAFNQSTESYQKYSDSILAYVHTTTDWCINTWKWMSLVFAIMPTTLLGTLPVGAYLYMHGSISLENFVICNILPLGFIVPIIRVIQHTSSLTLVKTALFYISGFLNQKELSRPSNDQKVSLDLTKGYEFNQVSFNYEQPTDDNSESVSNEANSTQNNTDNRTNPTKLRHNQHQALTYVSFKIKPNTVTAIVGHSGSGKTTIARLMASFWDCCEGVVSFGGVNIKDIPISQLYDHISYVSQDTYLFDLTIGQNIAMGNTLATPEQIEQAARSACCHDFIMTLPNGYDTHVGDSGLKLSGGEKQRISLARAILKNAPIVILDEATAYADPENEFYIQQALSKLCKNKTLIIVAHRLYTIKNADQILVMHEGKLVESGTHEQLISQHNYYYNLWQACAVNQ